MCSTVGKLISYHHEVERISPPHVAADKVSIKKNVPKPYTHAYRKEREASQPSVGVFSLSGGSATKTTLKQPRAGRIGSGHPEHKTQEGFWPRRHSGGSSQINLLCEPGVVQNSLKSPSESWSFSRCLEEGQDCTHSKG
ncbi:hypothetical protein CDAR_49041 [Caerostris darwini]|uniref:Uncharacterized protein n=1 Tax=Caerostris darwini TaxID=1538125 RepID=A0AAV4NHV0_9ARAC|nr:hypothetical protein CDAR_49041 [Caerostris darwini]